jgi:hypothetical protein
MPKARKSLEELSRTGTLRKHHERYQGRIAAQKAPIVPLGTAPAHLPDAEQKVWKELASAAPRGLLQRSDRIFVGLVARMVVRARTSGKTADECPGERALQTRIHSHLFASTWILHHLLNRKTSPHKTPRGTRCQNSIKPIVT